jgi:hypothetical protein
MIIKIKNSSEVKENEVTPQDIYLNHPFLTPCEAGILVL